jgi:ATP-dependent helicase/nuclease subunit A
MILTSNQLSSLDLSKNLSVKANAGSGKTAVLVERFVKILHSTDIKELNSIVGITFTEKAANELRNRIFKKLLNENQKENSVNSFHVSNLMERISSLQIGTIHSFCSSILREFANEAGLDSNFNIVQGMDEIMMLDEVIEDTLRAIINQPEEDYNRKALEDLIKIYGLKKLKGFLKSFMNERETVILLSENIYSADNDVICGKWIEAVARFTEMLIEQNGLIDYLTTHRNDWEPKLNEYLELYIEAKSLQERCYYFDLIYTIIFTKNTGEIKKTFLKKNEAGSESDFILIHNRLKKISDFQDFIKFFSSATNELSQIKYHIEITKNIISLFRAVLERYKHQKDMNAQLDFEDLLIRTRDLLKNENIASVLKERYRYILVDEYQDTNHLQAQILYSLLDDESKANLFIVGDPKQSIYGFRNAEVEIFNETEQKIVDERQGSKILLDESFRLLSDIIVFINYIFMKMQDSYTAESIPYQELIKARDCDAKGKVELLLYHENDDSYCVEEEMISHRILELMNSREQIYDIGSDKSRNLEYGDIAVLLRSRTHLDSLEKTFIKNNIPYIITSGIGYYQTQEIFDLYNYLCFLINPQDDLALVGILRSPFFFIPDSLLFEISITGNNMQSFWDKTMAYSEKTDTDDSLKNTVKILRENINISQRISIPNLINKIVTETNWYAVFSFQENGKQTLANLNKFLVIAREFEKRGFNTLFDFVEQLRILVSEENKEGQAVIDPTNQMVKIMTIHAAKGLEFPVLFLPYTHQSFKPDTEPYFNKSIGIGFSTPQENNLDEEYSHSIVSKYIKALNRLKSDSEEKRILYVALTRAHNMLFVSGKYESFKNGRNYLTWIKDALALDDLYIEPFDEEHKPEKSSKEKASDKKEKAHYPFFKSGEISVKDKLIVSKIENEVYVRNSIDDYSISINLTQGLKDVSCEVFPETEIIDYTDYKIAEQAINENLTENVLSATALQTYLDCHVKYFLRYSLGYPEALAQNLSIDLFQDSKKEYSIDDREVISLDPDLYAETDSPIILSGTMRGKILHSVFESIDNIVLGKNNVEDLIVRTLKEYYFSPEKIGEREVGLLKNLVLKFLESNICKKMLSYEKHINEFNLACPFNGDMLTGAIDRLCIDNNKILIIDYKTNKLTSGKLDIFRKMYSNQMLFYAYLVHRYFKTAEIESVLVFLEKPDDIIFEKYSINKLNSFETVLRESLNGISGLETGVVKPDKNFSSCLFCDYHNGSSCVY